MTNSDLTDKELKPNQYKAVTALITTGDAATAADTAGVSERTMRRWMTEPAFRNELRDAESELVRSAARRLGQLAGKALGVLEEILDNQNSADSPRIRAATTVLDVCLKWRDQVELEDRVKALESQIGKRS